MKNFAQAGQQKYVQNLDNNISEMHTKKFGVKHT